MKARTAHCKFCGCTDRRSCAIPMRYEPTPDDPGLLESFGDEYPIVLMPAGSVAEFTTPCHWIAPDICSAPACVEKAYRERCAWMDAVIAAELEAA